MIKQVFQYTERPLGCIDLNEMRQIYCFNQTNKFLVTMPEGTSRQDVPDSITLIDDIKPCSSHLKNLRIIWEDIFVIIN